MPQPQPRGPEVPVDVQAFQGLYTDMEPLTSDRIRLLRLSGPSEFLIEVPKTDGTQYAAVSYCWGMPDNLIPVKINDQVCQVRRHVVEMLNTLYEVHKETLVWIDMLCINQNDVDERSSQVRMMGNIYTQARKVYAWLGQGCADVEDVFDVLKAFSKWEESFDSSQIDSTELLRFHREMFWHFYEMRHGHLPAESDHDDENLLAEFNWIAALYAQPFWSRLWIVQELILAETVILCYGHKSVDFDTIYGLGLIWGSFGQSFDNGAFHRSNKCRTKGWHIMRAVRDHRRQKIDMLDGKFVKCSQGDVVNLDEAVVIYAKNNTCKDKKDYIYALLELVPQWKAKLEADYTQSGLEVFKQAVDLGLFDSAHPHRGGRHCAWILWNKMDLGPKEHFAVFAVSSNSKWIMGSGREILVRNCARAPGPEIEPDDSEILDEL
jgi:hypothetical protein